MADPVDGSTTAPPIPKAAVPPATPPAAAAKPAAKSKGDSAEPPDKMRRRVIWGMIYGYLGINLLMFLRFFFPRALYEPNTVFNIGYPRSEARQHPRYRKRQYHQQRNRRRQPSRRQKVRATARNRRTKCGGA